jgi:hypothetical protein
MHANTHSAVSSVMCAGHVTKPINEELKKCLQQSNDPNHGFTFPLELERTVLEESQPVSQNLLMPLCRHLKALAAPDGGTETDTSDSSEVEHDSRTFEWL